MKKLSFIFALLCVILLCACGKTDAVTVPAPSPTPTVTPTPAPVIEVQVDTPSPTPEVTPAVLDERFVGTWCISHAHNEYAALLEFFGTSLREYGSQLTISDDGTMSYYIGSSGGDGSWTSEGDTAHAEAGSEKLILKLIDIDGVNFLEMSFGGAPVIWQRAE